MTQEELIQELVIRENDTKAKIAALTAELDAISNLIEVYTGAGEIRIVRTRRNNSSDSKGLYSPKGKREWRTYALDILTILEQAKAIDVINVVIEANPKIEETKIRNAISGQLSKLYIDKVIDAEPGINKKDGYTYKIKKEPEGS